MALKYLFGNAGSGKSSCLYDHIIKEAVKNPEKQYLVLVPEQFTMSTQREFVERSDSHCIMNIDVLSFERLAYRVFDELGVTDLTVLKDIGKTLVLRKVVSEHEDELRVLKNQINRPGSLDQLKSIITEFSQYNIQAEDLEKIVNAEEEGLFKYKLNDLLILYKGFNSFIEGSYVTAETVLLKLNNIASESKILKDAVIAFDGYTGFTPIQNLLFETIVTMAEDLYVTILLDRNEVDAVLKGKQELFYLSKKYRDQVKKICDRNQVELLEEILPMPSERRFKEACDLAHLEENLFRSRPLSQVSSSGQIKLMDFANPREELRFVARRIKTLVSEGYRYKDFAIVTGDLKTYGDQGVLAFKEAGIPLYLDQKEPVTFDPLVEFILSALECIIYDYNYESLFRLLKSGLFDLEGQEIALLENYYLAAKIRGYKKLSVPFVNKTRDFRDQDSLFEVNRIRGYIAEIIGPFNEAMKDRQCINRIKAIYNLMESLNVRDKMAAFSSYAEKEGFYKKQIEYKKIYEAIIDLFEKYADLLGDEEMDIKEFKEILEAGIMSLKLSSIPMGRDQVILGDIDRSRLEHIKVLFFLGVNEGIIPKASTGNMCLTDKEREFLEKCDIELAMSVRDRIFVQRFYLYMVLCKPSEQLYVSYSNYDMSGKKLNPSYLVGTLERLFTDGSLRAMEEDYKDDLMSRDQAMTHLIKAMSDRGELSQEDRALVSYFAHDPEFKDRLCELVKARETCGPNEVISTELLRKLYSDKIKLSVSRLETFAACPMKHYLEYGIKVSEREMGGFSPIDRGTIYHGVLENYGRELSERGFDYKTVPDDIREELVTELVLKLSADKAPYTLYENKRTEYQINRMIRVMKRTTWALNRQLKESSFEPSLFEKTFYIRNEEGEGIELSNGFTMELKGKIDRIDLDKEGGRYRVIDYKSKAKDFMLGGILDGTALQLLTYLDGAEEILKKSYEENDFYCEGALYFGMRDPLLPGKLGAENEGGQLSEDELVSLRDRDLLTELNYKGIGDSVENYMKGHIEVSHDTLETLRQRNRDKILELGNEMVSGRVFAREHKSGSFSECEYCDYSALCGIDKNIDGYEKTVTMSNTEAKAILLAED